MRAMRAIRIRRQDREKKSLFSHNPYFLVRAFHIFTQARVVLEYSSATTTRGPDPRSGCRWQGVEPASTLAGGYLEVDQVLVSYDQALARVIFV